MYNKFNNDGSERVLLLVTGLSPQVVTETLYALAVQNVQRWVPTQVHIITTQEGANRAQLALLSEDPGWFAKLCRDYDLGPIKFNTEHIHVVPNRAGRLLDDIRSPEDNEHAADFITDTVRQFTANDDTELHISIAGGRKTMGYYLGYALSLYGRQQDRLSHVLVSEPFESSWDFFYPTPYERIIQVKGEKLANCADARVILAEIPFVRLRDSLPPGLLTGLLTGAAHFTDVVAEAQKALPPLSLILNPANRSITAGGESFTLKAAEFAFYWMFAARAQAARPGLHWSDTGIAEELLGYYGRLLPKASGEYQRAADAYQRGMSKDNFDPTKSHLHKAIIKALGERRAKPYLLQTMETIPGSRYHRQGLILPASAITFLPASLLAEKATK